MVEQGIMLQHVPECLACSLELSAKQTVSGECSHVLLATTITACTHAGIAVASRCGTSNTAERREASTGICEGFQVLE